MVKRESTAPFLFFSLDLPSGISSGFASITLPFILTQAGFSWQPLVTLLRSAFPPIFGAFCGVRLPISR
jgi:hypothetical protein